MQAAENNYQTKHPIANCQFYKVAIKLKKARLLLQKTLQRFHGVKRIHQVFTPFSFLRLGETYCRLLLTPEIIA